MTVDDDVRRSIEADCARLINLYAMLNDAGDWDRLAALYTPDARFARPSAPDDFIEGRENILAAFKARPPRSSRHVISNIVVDVESADAARAFSVIVLYQGDAADDGGLPKMSANSPLVGRFSDRLTRTGEGWRFAERQGRLDFQP
jgi:ketosteroid isomerase-like protein